MAGSIQGDVNQMIGMLGALSGLSGVPQRRAAEKAEIEKEKATQAALDKREQVLAQAAKTAGSAPQADVEGTVAYQTSQDIAKERTEVAKQQFERNPTRETYNKYSELRSATYNLPIMRLPADEDLQNQAMDRMAIQQEAKKKRRNFVRDYISKLSMYGETVGSIDTRNPGFANKIAAQYDRNARRRLMNQMDREAKDGKQ